MKAWHGTDKKFERFDRSFIGTGEGVAARGKGFNATLEKSVAIHFMNCSPGPKGRLYEVAVPELEEMLSLDKHVSDLGLCLESLARAVYMKHHGLDVDEMFDEAACHDDISFSYSDERAEDMFSRLLLNAYDKEALEELMEWSPGYDWDDAVKRLGPGSLGLDIDDDTGKQLYDVLKHVCGSEEAAQELLIEHRIYGTYGHEPIGSSDRALDSTSLVVFREDDIKILRCLEIDRSRSCDDAGGPSP